MDMQVGFAASCSSQIPASLGAKSVYLAEQRQRLFALIREFQQAVARPRDGLTEALRILRLILLCSVTYFAVVESLLDRLTAAGASPHRDQHRRLLVEIQETLDRCAVCAGKRIPAELAHVLDALVVHEIAIRLRSSDEPT